MRLQIKILNKTTQEDGTLKVDWELTGTKNDLSAVYTNTTALQGISSEQDNSIIGRTIIEFYGGEEEFRAYCNRKLAGPMAHQELLSIMDNAVKSMIANEPKPNPVTRRKTMRSFPTPKSGIIPKGYPLRGDN